jgi:hypothetical protein
MAAVASNDPLAEDRPLLEQDQEHLAGAVFQLDLGELDGRSSFSSIANTIRLAGTQVKGFVPCATSLSSTDRCA